MASITIPYITPIHFLEGVKCLKKTPFRVYLTVDSVEIRFQYDRFESKSETDHRFDQMLHLKLFLEELANLPVPVDLDELVQTYRKSPKSSFFPRR